MKWLTFLVCSFSFLKATSQSIDKAAIDAFVQTVDAKTPAALAEKLTTPYKTEPEKVRAIFRWITENIAYNTVAYQKSSRNTSGRFASFETDDSSSVLPPLNERIAQLVLQRRVAVCDGYARLFKTLCDYSGIRSEIIWGYARTNFGRIGKRFISNHTWNAVYIDSSWYLLDATWASGYISFGDVFVKQLNEAYYLALPQQFMEDHYPELSYWSLLEKTPTLREFQFSPFKSQAYIKYNIQSFKPAAGVIEAAVGDTLEFELETSGDVSQFFVAANPYFDAGILPLICDVPFSKPAFIKQGNILRYRYVLSSPQIQQLHVVLNDRVVLQYKVQVKQGLVVH